ncbi:MAG: aminopeptidase [Candidatus Ranarchaeia archaeon]
MSTNLPNSPNNIGEKKESVLEKKLFWKQRKPVWNELSPSQQKMVFQFAEEYKQFLHEARTERLAAKKIIALAKQAGFRFATKGVSVSTGSKLIFQEEKKVLALVVIGKESLAKGARLVASHIDCPRLDLKPRPLYEDSGTAYLKTHYYGGIKKFQWVNRPLALVGTVILGNGKSVDVTIGLRPTDPVLIINDLLPHLYRKVQADRKLPDGVTGEELNILVGGVSEEDKHAKEKVKLHVLRILHEQYGITEEDLVSAELEAVPAEPVRDAGLDRIFVVGYGQDDRVCSYCNLRAIMETSSPKYTAIAYFTDKEEIGSEGTTGAKGGFLGRLVNLLLRYEEKADSYDNHIQAFNHMHAISADVTAAFDPNWPQVHDKRNACRSGFGVVIEKYTGVRGKTGASDASAEMVAELRRIYNSAGVRWQPDELGKVDEGGGGTIAKFLTQYGIKIIDSGVPVWGMHSPFETTHKCDIYMAYKGYHAFFNAPVPKRET